MLRSALAFPIERLARPLLPPDVAAEFARPRAEPALVPPDAVCWQVFRNPVSMFVGGVTAVLLELGEPRVRTAVWEQSRFRTDPVGRLRRTGLAAMVTVYGARSRVEATAERVRGLHARISGATPAGQPYRADDPGLLRWVQATAAFAFLAAYRQFVKPVTAADADRYFAEGREASRLYGVEEPVESEAEFDALLHVIRARLEPSPILSELLAILGAAPILPRPLRPLQPVVMRAAVDLVPAPIRSDLRLEPHGGLSAPERTLLKTAAAAVDRIALPTHPASQACRRLGLPFDYLIRRGWRGSG